MIAADRLQTNRRYVAVYRARAALAARPSTPNDTNSEYRFPAAMNSDPNAATVRNHGEMVMPVAAPPATARSTNPAAMTASSITGSFFRPNEYADVATR